VENDVVVTSAAQKEMKEWQAIMNYLVSLPNKNPDGISMLEKDDRAREVRVIQTGS
jgi:5'-nucleotidase